MNCRDVLKVADSFLAGELLTETNHEILRHLETCPSCRAEIDARRRLRGALRDAFGRSPDLQPRVEFTSRLRDQLHEAATREQRGSKFPTRWLALAAGVVLAAVLGGALWLNRSASPDMQLAQDAIGDHQNCALKFRLVRMPVPLEEAAQQYDSAYRLLMNAPPDDVPAPGGPVHVVERHSCVFGDRRFGHVVMQYRGRVVSLLMTTNEGASTVVTAAAVPHLIGRPANGLSVVSVDGARHAILLVSDLDSSELAELSKVVSLPLVQQLQAFVPHVFGPLAVLRIPSSPPAAIQ